MAANSSNAQTPKLRWFQFRLRTIFTVVTIVGVQCAVCFPMLREWKSRTSCFEKLRKVGFALHNYEGNSHRRMPAIRSAAGFRMLSGPTPLWTVAPRDADH
jgi:hypothetical protein